MGATVLLKTANLNVSAGKVSLENIVKLVSLDNRFSLKEITCI